MLLVFRTISGYIPAFLSTWNEFLPDSGSMDGSIPAVQISHLIVN
ncbi:hypothetical protein [Sporocytophaga myxococcoides]|nr:hypothetical protein [Sporocytophaga myxococcoides]